MTPHRLELLVLQPTPFCNLDCTYCYLPDRANTARMSEEVLRSTFQRVFASSLPGRSFTVVWHAGEPLVMGTAWYEAAFAQIEALRPAGITVRHSMQTNGTLIDDAWCAFFRQHQVSVGVSLDGPEPLHDAKRVQRNGRGTWSRAMRGVERLQAHGLDFHVITVLSDASLEQADALFDFYVARGIRRVGFNVEEAEGKNARGSLEGQSERVRGFFRAFLARVKRSPGALQVRELEGLSGAIVGGGEEVPLGQEADPLRILNVDYQGNFSTFSPELLGAQSPLYGDFSLGNVLRDSLDEAAGGEKLARLQRDILAGVERCRRECPYFLLCGGGSPSNKHFETGRLDTTETNHCRNSRQAVIDVLLDAVEADLGIAIG